MLRRRARCVSQCALKLLRSQTHALRYTYTRTGAVFAAAAVVSNAAMVKMLGSGKARIEKSIRGRQTVQVLVARTAFMKGWHKKKKATPPIAGANYSQAAA